MLPPENIHPDVQGDFAHLALVLAAGSEIYQQVVQAQAEDKDCQDITRMIREGEQIHLTVSLGHCILDNKGAVRYRGALWVPESIQMRVVEVLHKAPDSGHPGIVRTVRLIKSRYYWPRLDRTVKTFIANCHECRRANAPRDTYHRVLNPLPIPDRL
jgi:hypothetical protein